MWLLKIFAGVVLALLSGLGIQHLRLSTSAALPVKASDHLRIATWNVHYIIVGRAEGRWGISGWEARKAPMDTVFKALGADIVAFQEMESFAWRAAASENLTRAWLLENNPDYAAAAIGPEAEFPSTQPILYRPEALALLDQGWFFFSETPDVIYSRTFNGSYPAFASWAQFQDKRTGAVFKVLNLHTDFASRSNRVKTSELIVERITPWLAAGETVIVAGDFNELHGWKPHRMVADAGISFPKVPHASFHLDRGLHLFGAIDHIGLSGAAQPGAGPFVYQNRPAGEVWPTDHHPVVLDVALEGS